MNHDLIYKSYTPILLCGGKGRRLLNKTKTVPKPLLEVAGKPILKHILIELKKNGFEECIIAVGYLGDLIKDAIGLNYQGIKIIYSDSGKNVGMLKRVYDASQLTKKNIYVTYGDTFTKVDWDSINSLDNIKNDYVTILTSKIQNPFGIIDVNEEMIVKKFREKPMLNYYIGHFFCSKNHIDKLNERFVNMKDGTGLVSWFHDLIASDKLYAHSNNGLQITFNTYTELKEADQKLSNYFSINEF